MLTITQGDYSMINAELKYNPYLLETEIRFNGQPPRVNSLVEKYQKMGLQSWVGRVPKIFYDEMNGYFFELDFTGTQLDYDTLCNTFRKAGITNEIVPVIHKKCLQDRITEQNMIDELLKWLENYPSRRFDYDAFRADNSDLFEGGYTYVFLHGRGLNGSALKDMNVSVEYVDKAEELSKTDLRCTPILIHITEESLPALAAELSYFKARQDVSEAQLFFSIGGMLDRMTVERVIRDLGVVNPKVVQTPSDAAVKKYIEVYPITDYIRNALTILREAAESISADVEHDNKESIEVNREIHERLSKIDESLERLRNARNSISGYSETLQVTSMKEMEEELIAKVNGWRGRKTKINKFDDAVSAAGEFEKDAIQYFLKYAEKIKKDASEKINGIKNDYLSEYNNAQYDDFIPMTEMADVPDIKMVESFAKDLLDIKEEKLVEAKEDLIGMFFKTRQSEEKHMVLETTYYYDKWRSHVIELIQPAVDGYIEQLALVYKDNLEALKDEYLSHIDTIIKQEENKRNEVASQLSEEEKLLQIDNEWLAQFNEQRLAIERGDKS